jgi:hypothetical protein
MRGIENNIPSCDIRVNLGQRAISRTAAHLKRFIWAVFLLLISGTVVHGQNLSLSSTTGAVSIPVAASDYDPVSGNAAALRLSGNTFGLKSTSSTWTLTVRALTSTFGFSPSLGDANPNKPCNQLSVRLNGTATWLPVSSASQVFATGPKQNLTAPPKQLAIDYQVLSSLTTDPPGNYSITLIWTLTNP